MSPGARRWLAAVALGFLLVLVARFPARWAKPLLPKSVICRELSGSVWSGNRTGPAPVIAPPTTKRSLWE